MMRNWQMLNNYAKSIKLWFKLTLNFSWKFHQPISEIEEEEK